MVYVCQTAPKAAKVSKQLPVLAIIINFASYILNLFYHRMALKNNIMIVRHKLLTELVKLWKNGKIGRAHV